MFSLLKIILRCSNFFVNLSSSGTYNLKSTTLVSTLKRFIVARDSHKENVSYRALILEQVPEFVSGIHHWFNIPNEISDSEAFSEGQLLDCLWKSGAKCIIVDFFAYSCTNCVRCVPVLKALQYVFYKITCH
jgi:hypothetical protein